ncbi:MAG: type II toxin-antitoxin system RelE/ParE family toxin [Actinobacteria bacterium]|nr:type II toxin-antitoxin system RelE/ParE family toxin [Actinomycetota bacterium]MCL5887460.1 type II toxin-antitoxin system RelE/ParE family toxin [Actinomycetota bacterium]
MSFDRDVWLDAELDITNAAIWYEQRSPGLGFQFLDAVDQTLESVFEAPLRFPEVHRDNRRALLSRFPYVIFFFIDEQFVRVTACSHVRQDPTSWQARRVDR